MTTERRGLMSVLDMTPTQIAREEWRAVGEVMKQAQDRLQADGSRQTWLDWAIVLCTERGKETTAEWLADYEMKRLQRYERLYEGLARAECRRQDIDPDDVIADGGHMAWHIVGYEAAVKEVRDV